MSNLQIKDIKLRDATRHMDMLSDEIGQWATDHGFREDWELAQFLEGLSEDDRSIIYISSSDRDKLKQAAEALRINIIGTKLMLICSEINEAMETLRKVGIAGIMNGEGNFGEELADAHIRIYDLSQLINFEKRIKTIGEEVFDKIIINRNRPYKHGKKC